jgi:nucleotide-binding universal stress UspA family protein
VKDVEEKQWISPENRISKATDNFFTNQGGINMFRKIMVPLDGSELAERALEPASELAKRVNGELLLLSVAVPEFVVAELSGVGVYWLDQAMERSRQEHLDYLQRVQGRITHSRCTVNVAVKEGDPASTIVDIAAEKGIDLIIMSTHGHSGFTRWMLGSVTTKVFHKATCPVLAVRSGEPISRVLITLDGSELAEQALEPGFEVAKRLGAQVRLLIMQATSEIDFTGIVELERAESGLGKKVLQHVYERDEKYLQNIADRYEVITGLKAPIVVADGPVAHGILHYAEEWGADLIVMATHGRTGLRRWVYGSITEKILGSAHCATMIIRPPEHKLS